jgi:hypothetical protein
MSLLRSASRSEGRSRSRVLASLAMVFLVVGGCGSGGTTTTQLEYFLQAIGPAGGTAQAGPVTLTIPPGAIPQDTSIAVLPEPAPFPIQQPAFDPCTYAFFGPVHCCGPIDLVLLVDGVLRISYDEALLPPGSTENDLVLLESDSQTQTMVIRTGPNIVHNTLLNYIEDTAYNPLSHVGLALRTCPNGRILVQNNPQAPLVLPNATGASGQLAAPSTELYIVDPLEVVLPAFVDTAGLPFTSFLASPSSDRVLLRASSPVTESSSLYTVALPAGGPATEVFTDDGSAGLFLQAYDPFFGWLKGAAGDEVFATYFHAGLQPAGSITPSTYELHRRDALASLPAVEMHERVAHSYYPEDIRQSLGGSDLMFRWGSQLSAGVLRASIIDGAVDVLASPSAVPASLGSIWPNMPGASPRFMTLSTDLYVVSNGTLVQRWTRAGALVGTLFDPGFESGETLIDFALAPDDETFAMVVDLQPFIGDLQQGLGSPQTELWMGTLTDGVLATFSFFSKQFVDELVWHPQQTGVFLDLSGLLVGFYRLEDGKGFFVSETTIPVDGMQRLDVNRVDGRILILPSGFSEQLQPAGAFLPPGLYVSPADASDFQQVDMPGLNDPVQARWVESWRAQPGMGSPRVR